MNKREKNLALFEIIGFSVVVLLVFLYGFYQNERLRKELSTVKQELSTVKQELYSGREEEKIESGYTQIKLMARFLQRLRTLQRNITYGGEYEDDEAFFLCEDIEDTFIKPLQENMSQIESDLGTPILTQINESCETLEKLREIQEEFYLLPTVNEFILEKLDEMDSETRKTKEFISLKEECELYKDWWEIPYSSPTVYIFF